VYEDEHPTLTQHSSSTTPSRHLCDLAVSALPIDGAALVAMTSTGARELIYATDTVAQQLDELQFALGEGPCVDAFRERRPVIEPDLSGTSAERNWPGFSREATTLGTGALFAFPLQAAGVAFGTLELYRREAGELGDADIHAALLIATAADHLVLHELSHAAFASADDAHAEAIGGRTEVHRATGMVAVQLGVSIQDAIDRLRATAYAENASLNEVARDVVTRARRFRPDQ
jgi:hypothetical protein